MKKLHVFLKVLPFLGMAINFSQAAQGNPYGRPGMAPHPSFYGQQHPGQIPVRPGDGYPPGSFPPRGTSGAPMRPGMPERPFYGRQLPPQSMPPREQMYPSGLMHPSYGRQLPPNGVIPHPPYGQRPHPKSPYPASSPPYRSLSPDNSQMMQSGHLSSHPNEPRYPYPSRLGR